MKKIRGIQSLPKEATYDEMDSPVGLLTIITSVKGLHAIIWDIDRANPRWEHSLSGLIHSKNDPTMIETKKQLTGYFQKKRKTFDLPLVLEGTEFQVAAWNQLVKIPYATTICYAEQAERMGDRNKARAVGMANGLNPISIVIPCHRVIGRNGDLVGFGGGLEKKAYLLNLESISSTYVHHFIK
ncbi:MAG: methylated-DNA--[protein]-cysteine S-methyltransferase [Legionellales bacterium]|nr:methylated-DNA--[protein]-cysteine S-methyltransferase [Legionellales bacterium]